MVRPATRGTLILLAIALNGWPWLRADGSMPAFAIPPQVQSAAATAFIAGGIHRPEVAAPDVPCRVDWRVAGWIPGCGVVRRLAGRARATSPFTSPASARPGRRGRRRAADRHAGIRHARVEPLYQESRQLVDLRGFGGQAVAALRHCVDRRLVGQFTEPDDLHRREESRGRQASG